MQKLFAFIFLLMALLSACVLAPSGEGESTAVVITAEVSTVIAVGGGTEQPFPTPDPPTMIPTLAGGLSVTELKYRVLEKFPDFFYCDPDYYPIAREDEADLAKQAFPELQQNQEEFQTIMNHTGLSSQTTFTDEQQLQIYQEHKKLNAVYFEFVDDRYKFQIKTGSEGQSGSAVTGTIDGSGTILVSRTEPAIVSCPICLAVGTLIDTPRGPIRVEVLRVGDSVWTMNEAGQRVAVSIEKTGHVRVPSTHQMIHVTLSDGRQLWASPGHPAADGRRLRDLGTGDTLDGAQISEIERVSYVHTYTYDILPSGATGIYWANGILMGSTLSSP